MPFSKGGPSQSCSRVSDYPILTDRGCQRRLLWTRNVGEPTADPSATGATIDCRVAVASFVPTGQASSLVDPNIRIVEHTHPRAGVGSGLYKRLSEWSVAGRMVIERITVASLRNLSVSRERAGMVHSEILSWLGAMEARDRRSSA